MKPVCKRYRVVGSGIDATSYDDAIARLLDWARAGESRYLIAANVHVVMEAHDDPSFRTVVAEADLVTPDGMPLVWALRQLGEAGQQRVYGPDLMLRLCERAAEDGIAVGFYGGSDRTLTALQARLRQRFPALRMVYAHAPPFRPLTTDEDAADVAAIDAAGVRILFVGLGCPKQERWAAVHRGRVQAVMLAVGAAFDFHAGTVKQAPHWIQRCGLEWFYRLCREPRRLWRRYFKHNPRFVWRFWCERASRG